MSRIIDFKRKMVSQMSIDELIDGKILELGNQNPEIGSRLKLYQETFRMNEKYDKIMFYTVLELIEVIFPRNLGFLWNSETGEVVLQYRKDTDGSLVRVLLRDSSILVVDSHQEHKCADLDSFRSVFLGGQDEKAI